MNKYNGKPQTKTKHSSSNPAFSITLGIIAEISPIGKP